jgi:excisionase family DNA binding protein
MDTLLLSKHEAARILGLSIRSLEHLISNSELPVCRVGRRVLISKKALEEFANANGERTRFIQSADTATAEDSAK